MGVFVAGVAALGLSGAPDERGFWPVLLVALGSGLLVARDRTGYLEVAIRGMARPIVMLMVMAWILAGVLGSLVNASGFVEALVSLASTLGVTGGGYVAAAFAISAVVSTSTGTSLGTVILCAPLLYPSGGVLGADPALLIAAVLGGATFGDNISPISDTTIASASTQAADIGGVVRSRLKYAVPAGVVALALYAALGGSPGGEGAGGRLPHASPVALSVVAGPVLTLGLLLLRRHLVEALLAGIVAVIAVGLGAGLFEAGDLLFIDREAFLARGLVLEGMERAVGVSVFTLLLMGVVAGVEAAGVLEWLENAVAGRSSTALRTEWWTFGAVSAAVLLTTHSAVAILGVGDFVKETGEATGVSAYRRANILDVTVCTYPFLLPFFVPTILAASTTASGADFGMPRIGPLELGLLNFHSWGLLAAVVLAIATGYGRGEGREA